MNFIPLKELAILHAPRTVMKFIDATGVEREIWSVEVQPLGATRLKAEWTSEMAQDLEAFHNIDAEAELTKIAGEEFAKEIDKEVIANLLRTSALPPRVPYRGETHLEAGYIYAPYIPVMVSPITIVEGAFQPNQAMLERYSHRVINNGQYSTINIANAAVPAGINFNINVNNIPVLTSEGLQFFPVTQMKLPRANKGTNIEALKELRAATIEKWRALGLLDNMPNVTIEEAQ